MPSVDLLDDTPLSQKTFLGIDPGSSGGLAWVTSDGKVHAVRSMPNSDRELLNLLKTIAPVKFAVVEKVGGYTGEGQPGSAMFNFGVGVGKILMALTALEIPFEQVMPQKWQKVYSMSRKKGEKKTAWKARLKEVAARLFPAVKVTLNISDALLISEYARRVHNGDTVEEVLSRKLEKKISLS